MTIPNRTVSIKSVFASTANTTIPTPPATGVSYRNTETTAAEIGEGWPFKEVVDSAKFNQSMYEYTTICQQLEKYGFLPWSANTDYPAQGCALGSDGKVYQAKQATGPATTAVDPTTDTNHTYWDLFYYADVTADRALISNASGKMAASGVTAAELGYLSGVTSAIQTQINNKAADNAVVHIARNETITGTKTFTQAIDTVWSNMTKGTAPSSNTYNVMLWGSDKNAKAMGAFKLGYLTNKQIKMTIAAYNGNTTDSAGNGVYLELFNDNGVGYAKCPTPIENNTSSTQIDTVGARNTQINAILSALYPVGSLYITTNNSPTCPLASLISGSSWSLVAADKALWTSNRNGNTTINAGLPNISGTFGSGCMMNWQDSYASGAFYRATLSQYPQNAGGTDGGSNVGIGFQASRSNSIYGNSSTVQPPAYRVNVWRRTA